MTLKCNVRGKVNIKRRIIVNGIEYASVEEMPEDIRQLYNAAMTPVEAHGNVKFGALKAHGAASAPLGPAGHTNAHPPSMAPIEAGGGSTSRVLRVVIPAVVVLVLLGALNYLDTLPR